MKQSANAFYATLTNITIKRSSLSSQANLLQGNPKNRSFYMKLQEINNQNFDAGISKFTIVKFFLLRSTADLSVEVIGCNNEFKTTRFTQSF